ncbi:hypothetical protein BDY19DRAFT_946409 [Irpex rosettiformis]|uniref:Uncharacterized protein n=1 Tax=Irpex rosettiformis TaxID=378272 RepID=A0ACB8U399_9APHY|nr:hypothetical protein BDY19DRAFT_946409 [Irpex rosettiformis]
MSTPKSKRKGAGKTQNERKPLIASNDKKTLLQEVLRLSLTDGSFIDTKFYAFSRRRSTGVVDEPLPVYANSGMLRANSKYFDGFFDGGFQVKLAPLRAPFPSDSPDSTEEYDYESDSDLEDEFQTERASKSEEMQDDEGADSADHPAAKSEVAEPAETTPDPTVANTALLDASIENYGHVIVVPDIAFTTWRAMIFWLYTGEITFAKLKSQSAPNEDGATLRPSKPLQCSPKSMYRLADKCGIDELKKLSLENIRSKLSTDNIAVELRCRLPSLYEEVRNVVIEYACQSARSVVTAVVPQWIDDLASGKDMLEGSADTLKALYQKSVTSDTTSTAPTNWNVNRCGNCRRQNILNMSVWYRYCNSCGGYYTPSP